MDIAAHEGNLHPAGDWNAGVGDCREFKVVLIKPSRYDETGYVVQWVRSAVPSNTLAALYSLFEDCGQRNVLGESVDITVQAHDESNTRIEVDKIARQLKAPGVRGMVGLVGVQTNQFPRAMDMARAFRAQGIPVCLGGFHVSGSLAMLPGVQPELQEAMDLGISLFAGEAERRLDRVVRDAFVDQLQSLYDYSKELPDLAETPVPYLPPVTARRTVSHQASFDAGRGCPFQCSFCTIINVQGRVSRRRSPDDIEEILRTNFAQGISHYFITDDNFSRNRDWEPIFDRIIELRADGIKVKLTIQVDTLCHKIDGFIEKAGRAGVKKVFIGLESINPEALKGAKKRQNRLSEYREMMQAWHAIGVITYAGYILGFPTDTLASIQNEIRIIQRELPIDILEFFMLTPLPGSEDHQKLFEQGKWLDPDLNRYDLNHACAEHPLMSRAEWERATRIAWETYYSWDHVETLLRRAAASGIKTRKMAKMILWFRGCILYEGIHPLEGGYFRRRFRADRRPSAGIESAVRFYPKRAWEVCRKAAQLGTLVVRLEILRRRVEREAQRTPYVDTALTPTTLAEQGTLEIFSDRKVA
jgi:radical SAM superfamily enzyme YgiQ (UPF0313 family)